MTILRIKYLPKFFFKKFQKICNFKFWNDAKNPIFNFFQIFFFLNHYYDLYFHFKKSDWRNIVSLYLIFKKPQKPPNLREKREYPAKTWINNFFDPKFGISDQKLFRIDIWDTQNMTSIYFCCTVLSMLPVPSLSKIIPEVSQAKPL